ncbi:MAG: LysM peptidoglycan-binding domain-containing protein, partial [Planctomycetota bacterium]
ATIRRWCSARWRIGDSRRMRAAQLLLTLQAEWVADGAHPDWKPVSAPTDLGTLSVGRNGLRSSVYGSVAFLTPIAELAFATVTQGEADAYKRFHERYQSQWRDYFDPLAVRLGRSTSGSLSVDLSVLPLIAGSEYRQLIRLVGTASLEAGAGDPHAALFQIALAIDRDGELLAEADRNVGRTLGRITSPLGWIGRTASLYVDPDPIWAELAAVPGSLKRLRFVQDNISRLPLGLNVSVADPLKLALCLTALRGMVDQSAPGMAEWNQRTWKDIPYVMISPAAQARGMMGPRDMQIGYVALPEGLTVSPNEAVIQRAIDRILATRAVSTTGKPAVPTPWPGTHAALSVDPAAIQTVINVIEDHTSLSGWLRERSLANIAILNEWKRLFPNEDPVAVHERLWGTRLTCPGGGNYVWNERWLTMESTVYGNDFAAKEGPEVPAALASIARISAGIGFEELPPAEPAAAEGKPAAANGESAYTVQRGDTLVSIARAKNTTIEALVERNDLHTNTLAPGQVLTIPTANTVHLGRPSRRDAETTSYALRLRLEIEPKTAK